MPALSERRALEVGVALVASSLAVPVVAVAAAVVRWRLGSPVLFRQERAGQHGKPFHIVKLRTMTLGTAPDSERLTALGRWLRATSIDELPSLWNVLRGDMALVGPRPLPVRYLDRYRPSERRRHDVRPGLTGWAQVHGRNAATWDDRLAMDVWYVDNRSLRLDLCILWRTCTSVARRTGISADGEATMSELDPQRTS